jgi:hypothetical protein
MARMPFSERVCITGENGFSNILPKGKTLGEGLDDCIGKALKENPSLSRRRISKTLIIRVTTVRSHLTESLGIK